MKRTTTLTALAGLSGLGAATLAGAPAVAAPITGCGEAPEGATLQRIGDVCQLDVTGSMEWAVPEGLTDLYAVVVGAGGGAYFRSGGGFYEGYAGAGGDVRYLDLGAPAAGAVIEAEVGDGGLSDEVPSSGSSSSVTYDGTTYPAFGGSAGEFLGSYCDLPGVTLSYVAYIGNGNGAGGPAGFGSCDTAVGPGIDPSRDPDSDDEDALAIFADYSASLGAGGQVLPAASAPVAELPGQGANILYTADEMNADFSGAEGLVVFRYTATAPADSGGGDTGGGDTGGGDGGGDAGGGTIGGGDRPGGGAVADSGGAARLPETGFDAGPVTATAVAMAAFGWALFASARRRDARRERRSAS